MELTEALRAEIVALAPIVVSDRLSRAVEVGTTSKGRVICEFVGEPTEAERRWVEIEKGFRRENRPE
jgi:hypothetical protein